MRETEIDFTDWRPGTFVRWHGLKKIFRKYIRPDYSVLDLGGCDGAIAEAITKTISARVTVVDIDKAGLEKARSRGMKTIEASVTGVPVSSESFDAILALDLLEHVEDDALIIEEIARILKPGGIVIISTPFINRRFLPADRAETLELHKDWGHLRPGYTRMELVRKLSKAGLNVISVTSCFNILSQAAYYFLTRNPNNSKRAPIFKRIVGKFEPMFPLLGFDMVVVSRKSGIDHDSK